jgi:hypothetical protein
VGDEKQAGGWFSYSPLAVGGSMTPERQTRLDRLRALVDDPEPDVRDYPADQLRILGPLPLSGWRFEVRADGWWRPVDPALEQHRAEDPELTGHLWQKAVPDGAAVSCRSGLNPTAEGRSTWWLLHGCDEAMPEIVLAVPGFAITTYRLGTVWAAEYFGPPQDITVTTVGERLTVRLGRRPHYLPDEWPDLKWFPGARCVERASVGSSSPRIRVTKGVPAFGPGIVVAVVFPRIGLYLLYWVIRVAVRHGILDAKRRDVTLGDSRAVAVGPPAAKP